MNRLPHRIGCQEPNKPLRRSLQPSLGVRSWSFYIHTICKPRVKLKPMTSMFTNLAVTCLLAVNGFVKGAKLAFAKSRKIWANTIQIKVVHGLWTMDSHRLNQGKPKMLSDSFICSIHKTSLFPIAQPLKLYWEINYFSQKFICNIPPSYIFHRMKWF